MIDFHSHILPSIDDGSRNVDESIALLKMSADQGIDRIVATPHFYMDQDTIESFLEKRQRSFETLLERDLNGLPQIELGAEVYFYEELCQADLLSDLAVGGGRYILIEMPFEAWTRRLLDALYRMSIKRRLIPIIAHLERYLPFQKDMGKIQALFTMDVLIQINGSFINNRKTRRQAMKWLKYGNVHILGSDCHNMENRKPNLGPAFEAIEKKLGMSKINEIYQYGQMILD